MVKAEFFYGIFHQPSSTSLCARTRGFYLKFALWWTTTQQVTSPWYCEWLLAVRNVELTNIAWNFLLPTSTSPRRELTARVTSCCIKKRPFIRVKKKKKTRKTAHEFPNTQNISLNPVDISNIEHNYTTNVTIGVKQYLSSQLEEISCAICLILDFYLLQSNAKRDIQYLRSLVLKVQQMVV